MHRVHGGARARPLAGMAVADAGDKLELACAGLEELVRGRELGSSKSMVGGERQRGCR